ncbi:DUF4167 domain-containing protein [Sediminimonas sp.]|uniref:DUF4167 domain-containing protein n=1 Tax=Sediminimonas sp. TaxID=2823379 RepID=UPI0025E3D3BB|nr:DUF4167 domain-containing protein [Sediminimonas sp.]
MRSSKSRSRSKSNRNSGRSVGNVVNRVFESSGPEGKVRGTPQQIIDKYNQLARDAQLGNDRVAAENFQQHAEHYLRMLSEAQREMDQRREQQERENRERQAERDRAQRHDRDGNGNDGGNAPPQQGKPKEADSATQGAEVAAEGEGVDESTLVETPENKPRKQRAPRGRTGIPRKPKGEGKNDRDNSKAARNDGQSGGDDSGSDKSDNSGDDGTPPDTPAAAE